MHSTVRILLADRIENMKQVYNLLERYERREAISLLECALWKAKMNQSMSGTYITYLPTTSDSTIERQACRVNCGAEIAIPNVWPFLHVISP